MNILYVAGLVAFGSFTALACGGGDKPATDVTTQQTTETEQTSSSGSSTTTTTETQPSQ